MKGHVYRWNPAKGLGNIIGEDSNDYFFHVSSVLNRTAERIDLELDEPVSFTVLHNRLKGDVAINITRERN